MLLSQLFIFLMKLVHFISQRVSEYCRLNISSALGMSLSLEGDHLCCNQLSYVSSFKY